MHLRLVVGLGNPGSKYARTRHNVGFMVVERLAERHNLRFKGSKQRADVARGSVCGLDTLLAMPVTYMNESGNAVVRLLDYYKVPLGNVLVICDDMDLPFGSLRLRPNGSSGGNNGLRSIAQSLKSEDFARLRLGIGRPESGAISHVLGRFSPDQEPLVPALLDRACDAVCAALTEGVGPAMNLYNRNWLDDLRLA